MSENLYNEVSLNRGSREVPATDPVPKYPPYCAVMGMAKRMRRSLVVNSVMEFARA